MVAAAEEAEAVLYMEQLQFKQLITQLPLAVAPVTLVGQETMGVTLQLVQLLHLVAVEAEQILIIDELE